MVSAMADWGFHPMLVWTSLALVMLSACSQEPAEQESGGAEEMASGGALSFFADEQDARILLGRLNADPEIAFIAPDGPRMPPPMPASPPIGDRPYIAAMATCGWDGYWQRWRAVRPVDGLKDGEHILWHISAGPLVISDGRELRPIPDP